ncbi:unnamed protein product, partial [Amoebophrya sp. A120]|eukprot:GSA120T00013781001.1
MPPLSPLVGPHDVEAAGTRTPPEQEPQGQHDVLDQADFDMFNSTFRTTPTPPPPPEDEFHGTSRDTLGPLPSR